MVLTQLASERRRKAITGLQDDVNQLMENSCIASPERQGCWIDENAFFLDFIFVNCVLTHLVFTNGPSECGPYYGGATHEKTKNYIKRS